MKYRLFLWDFDGSLADTLPDVLRIYNRLAVEHGFKPVDDPEAVRNMTMHSFLTAHRIPLVKVPFLMREVAAQQRQLAASVRLYEGLPEIVLRLHHAGCRQGIVSSNSEENIRACLRSNEVDQCFELVKGYSRLFGKHRSLQQILQDQRLKPQEAIYLGDEVRDVRAAQAVGMDMAALGWGINSLKKLAEYSPTYSAASRDELRALVAQWTDDGDPSHEKLR